ncbi:formate dehydrogenase subunit delta [Taklimakanibacter albus]|nr:formate dehydrogenase subunit delta [Aestuariivirga sp. YIM B02566]
MDQFSDIKRMANQIATAFAAYPEEQAVKETANHIKSFWDPRMRKQLAEVMAKEASALNPVAFAAGKQLGLG